MSDHDAVAVIEAFVVPDRQQRYLALLRSERGRAKARAMLAHFRDLDPSHVRPLPPEHHTAARLTLVLQEKGAPAECYLFAEDAALDGRRVPLRTV